MSPESPQEFRHYRLTVSAAVFGLTTIAVLWLASSVGVALFARPEDRPVASRFSGAPTDVDGMLRCQGQLETLVGELNAMLSELVVGPSGGAAEVRQRFEQTWPERWRATGSECRFEELRDRGVGASYDHLAWVHAELDEVHRGYAVFLESYIAHHEPRVAEIRRALESSRKTLEKKRAAGSPSRTG